MAVYPVVPTDIEIALGKRYIVGSEIVSAGQAAIFRATRLFQPDGTPAHDTVVLKLRFYPPPEIRVQRELDTIQQVSHPSLSRLIEHGYGEVAGRHTRFAAWEFVAGRTLKDRLKSGPLLESEVVAIGRDISAAIAATWSKHVVHEDVKPSNIMLRESGGAFLMDLGGARYLEQANSLAARKPFGLGYFSPEQARGERNLSYTSDIFSLGVVMLESLLGRHPTDRQQDALADGIRASGGTVAASVGLLCMLDKMLSARPVFRPIPSDLSRFFLRLQQRLEEGPAISVRSPKEAHG